MLFYFDYFHVALMWHGEIVRFFIYNVQIRYFNNSFNIFKYFVNLTMQSSEDICIIFQVIKWQMSNLFQLLSIQDRISWLE